MRLYQRILGDIDWLLLIPVILLLFLSLSTLFSIDVEVFRSQFIFALFSLIAFVFFTQINPNILKSFSIHIYTFSIITLILVLVIGVESHGASRWIELLSVRLQFSEILKPFLAISLASFITQRGRNELSTFMTTLGLLVPIIFLIYLQPDLGNSLIYIGVVLFTLLIYGFPLKYFVLSFIIWIGVLPFFWFILHDYQRQRILTFLNPSQDLLGASYNSIQAIIAVGSGMIWGRGLGQGTQSVLNFLPEHHTDFIFATISEEFGFIGSVIVVLAFGFLLYRIYLIYKRSIDGFSQAFSIIFFFIILIHFAINVGMNVGLVPVVGVTLPFVSSGGSSLLSNFILLGLLIAITKRSKRSGVLEIG